MEHYIALGEVLELLRRGGRNGISDIRRWEVITAAALDTVIAGYLLHISVLSNTQNT